MFGKLYRYVKFAVLDALLISSSLYLSYAVRFDFSIPSISIIQLRRLIGIVIIIYLASFLYFGLYKRMWQYTGISDLVLVAKAVSLGTAMLVVLDFWQNYRIGFLLGGLLLIVALIRRGGEGRLRMLAERLGYLGVVIFLALIALVIYPVLKTVFYTFFPRYVSIWGGFREIFIVPKAPAKIPRSIVILDWIFTLLFVGGSRIALRMIRERGKVKPSKIKKVLIFGAGDAGEQIVREMMRNKELGYQPVGFLDDDTRKRGMRIHGVEVLGGKEDVKQIVTERGIDEIIIAIPSIGRDEFEQIVRSCQIPGVELKTLPSLGELIDGRVRIDHIRKVRRGLRNILVIGGAGYIGSVLVRELLRRNYSVTVLDALIYGDEGIRDLFGHPDFNLIHDDFRNIETAVRSMQHIDAVIHLGALVGDPACSLNEDLTLEVNLAATRMLADVGRGSGVRRFIFASTCSVYGSSDGLLDEDSPLNPISLYARTKMDSERALLSLGNESFVPTVLRFATVYGLSPRPRFDLVVNLLTAKAVCEKSITIFGGKQWRPFVHVRDVADAIIRCLEAPSEVVKGQVFNVGSDEQNYQIGQIGEIIRDLIPDVKVIYKTEDVDKRNYKVSFVKIRKCLGFSPRYRLTDGIMEIKAALEQGHIRNYRNSKYSNYRTLSEEADSLLVRETYMKPLYISNQNLS